MSSQVFQSVVDAISPNAVVFVSKKAYENAKKGGVLEFLPTPGIKQEHVTYTPYPARWWWNKIAKAYKNKTGKERFISFLKSNCRSVS